MEAGYRIDGGVAVITGAGGGIGRALAVGFAAAGAHVVVAEIDDAKAAETVRLATDAAGAGVRVLGVATDVADKASVRDLAAKVASEFGRVDILINNAALEGAPKPSPIDVLDEQYYDRTMAVNLKGMWLTVQALLPHFLAESGGAVLNMGSIGSYLAIGENLHYNVAKAGVVTLTKTLAKELGPRRIRVNCLVPGSVATDVVKANVSPEVLAGIVGSQTLTEQITPEDIVDPALFLVSKAGRFVTGQALVVDGGVVMSG